jgi:hypothetical protein
VPTYIGGHGGPPYFTKMASNLMKFHMSAASGLKNGQSDRKRNFGNVSYEDSVFTDT